MSDRPLLRVTGLTKRFDLEAGLFASRGRKVWAVNGVSFHVERGETYGLVGESGSGKTTLARTIVQLVEHSAGKIEYFAPDGSPPWEITRSNPNVLKRFRSRVRYVFQDPASSLDPRLNVEKILTLGEPQRTYRSKNELKKKAIEVLSAVGLRTADLERRPSEFSGGQRQRIALARALMANPELLICDEIVSALDVSVQGQILNLLTDLKTQYSLTLLFIAHDLNVVGYMSDRIGVLYGGRFMEEGPSRSVSSNPIHPYSKLLYESMPELGKELAAKQDYAAGFFTPTVEPRGCPFVGRCPIAVETCATRFPEWETKGESKVACSVVGSSSHGLAAPPKGRLV